MAYSHGIKWNDEKIKEKILEVKDGLGIDRMPSRKETEQFYNDNRLASAISHRRGWRHYANELGLEIKKSETEFGKINESFVDTLLKQKGYSTRRMPQNHPYDILLNDNIKIDVKASRLYRGKNGSFYAFNLEKEYPTCDVFILVAIKDDNKKIYVVPSVAVSGQVQISIGGTNSKYNIYLERWDFIDAFDEFYKKISLVTRFGAA